MSSCNYRLLNDLYEAIETNLAAISDKIDALDVTVKIDELDVDLDNLEQQLIINNKLRLLELIGTDIMTEEQQTEAYEAIRDVLFAPSGSADGEEN